MDCISTGSLRPTYFLKLEGQGHRLLSSVQILVDPNLELFHLLLHLAWKVIVDCQTRLSLVLLVPHLIILEGLGQSILSSDM